MAVERSDRGTPMISDPFSLECILAEKRVAVLAHFAHFHVKNAQELQRVLEQRSSLEKKDH